MSVRHRWKLDDLVAAYEEYTLRVRGTAQATARASGRAVRRCLRAVLGDDPVDLRRLRGSDLVEFVLASATTSGPYMADSLGYALRSFFRFLHVQGLHGSQLESVIPRVRRPGRLAGLPRGLTEEQFSDLLASLASDTPLALRDRAIVLCLARLGLRGKEVADLRLTDVDWCMGTLHLRTRKTRRGAVLPLPTDVARAIAAYLLDGRPDSSSEHVFVRHKCGVGLRLRSIAVGLAVTKAYRRAGIAAPIAGSYALRHTFATRMVSHGARLKEIADVLGHRSLDTTAIYAKVDVPSLAQVALPWPEVTP